MLNKIFNFVALILLFSTASASINVCPKGLDSYYSFSLAQFKTSIQENSISYLLENTIKIDHSYMSLEILPKEMSYISLILSKDIHKSNLKENALAFDFDFQRRKKVLLKIKKYLTGASSENKDEIITLDPIIQESQKGPNAIDEINKEIMKFDIYLEKTEIKIMLFKKVIYSKKFDLEKLLGDSINVYLESSKDKKENAIQDFSVCYLKGESNPPRNLQEKEETTLDHFEVDNYPIRTSPNVLTDGNIEIIPSVVFHPKSKNGNFPSEILNYSRKKLKKLFNLVHSKNESLDYHVIFQKKKH